MHRLGNVDLRRRAQTLTAGERDGGNERQTGTHRGMVCHRRAGRSREVRRHCGANAPPSWPTRRDARIADPLGHVERGEKMRMHPSKLLVEQVQRAVLQLVPRTAPDPRVVASARCIRAHRARRSLRSCLASVASCDAEGDFVVDLERAVVEVARADGAPDAVDGHHLLVQQRLRVLEDAHAAARAARRSCDALRAAPPGSPRPRPKAPSRARRRRARRPGPSPRSRRGRAGSTGSGSTAACAPGTATRWCRIFTAGAAPSGLMRATCTATSPAGSSGGNTSSPTNSSPVSSIQFSLNADCTACTTGPRSRTPMSRKCSPSCAVAEPAVDDAVAADQRDAAVEHDELAVVAPVQLADVAQRVFAVEQHELAAGVAQLPLRRARPSSCRRRRRPARAPARRRAAARTARRRARRPSSPSFHRNVSKCTDRVAACDLLEQRLEEGAVLEHLDRVAFDSAAVRQAGERRRRARRAARRIRPAGAGRRAA